MKINKRVSYGLNSPLVNASPQPIISNRTPKATDRAEFGTLWIYNRPIADGGGTNTYVLTGVSSKVSSWVLVSGESFGLASVATPTVDVDIANDISRGYATFTGFTTASAASQEFGLNSDLIAEGAGVLISASNGGVNDAQMTVTRVEVDDGALTVTLTNNGAAALSGDVIISFDLMF